MKFNRKPAITIAMLGVLGLLALVMFRFMVEPRVEPLRVVTPARERSGEQEPIDYARAMSIASTVPTFSIVAGHRGTPEIVGDCEPTDTAAVESIFLEKSVRADVDVSEMPARSDLAVIANLSARLVGLLSSDAGAAGRASAALAASLGPGSAPLLERFAATPPPEFRVARVVAVPSRIGGTSNIRVQQDRDDMPPGTPGSAIPLELRLSMRYQTADQRDRGLAVNFIFDRQRGAWVLDDVGTIPDDGTLRRLMNDVEAQNRLISTVIFLPDDPDGVIAVRNGEAVHLPNPTP